SSTSPRMVRPIDLCSANTRTLAGVRPICTMPNPITPCAMISAATSQWNARTMAPQPWSVLRSGTRPAPHQLVHGLLVIALRAAVQRGFDFQPDRNPGADGLRKRGAAELRAIERRVAREARDRLESEQRRAHAVDGELDLHRQRDAAQGEFAVECPGVLTGFGHGAAFEMRCREFRRIQEIASRHRLVPTLVAKIGRSEI